MKTPPGNTHDVAAEFLTIDLILASTATTRNTDALILSWVKVEKQLRRLFSFLVYQNPAFSKSDESALVRVFVSHRRLYWDSFITCIDAHGPVTVAQLVGPDYDKSVKSLDRIRDHRNKILHGQITGQNLTSAQLEAHIAFLRHWVQHLAEAAQATLGYDGIGRNTFRKAKANAATTRVTYPFSSVLGFERWLKRTV